MAQQLIPEQPQHIWKKDVKTRTNIEMCWESIDASVFWSTYGNIWAWPKLFKPISNWNIQLHDSTERAVNRSQTKAYWHKQCTWTNPCLLLDDNFRYYCWFLTAITQKHHSNLWPPNGKLKCLDAGNSLPVSSLVIHTSLIPWSAMRKWMGLMSWSTW